MELLGLEKLLELMLPGLMLLAWVLLWELLCAPVLRVLCLGTFFFPGYLGPAFVRFGLIRGFRLDRTRIFF